MYDYTEPYIIESVQPQCRALDIGCGDGWVAHLLSVAGSREVVAFDINPDVIEVASRTNLGPVYLVGDAEDREFLSTLGKFDLIVIRNTFHHFVSKDEFLRFVSEVLNPGGKLLLIDVDRESNFSSLGTIFSFLNFALHHRLKATAQMFWNTRLFLGRSFRDHRKNDRKRLKQEGWYCAKDVGNRLQSILPNSRFKRMGTIWGYGGVYVLDWTRN